MADGQSRAAAGALSVAAIAERDRRPLRMLVTGGAGFVGSHTVAALLERGHSVRVLDNFSTGRREHIPFHSALDVMAGDVRDLRAVEAAMRGCDRVLHLASHGSVSASVVNPLESFQVNVAGFLNVLEAGHRQRLGKFVYASSETPAGAPAPDSPYALEQLFDGQYAALYARLYGMPCLGLHYGHVYGPRQNPSSPYADPLACIIEAVAQGRRPRYDSGKFTGKLFSFVDDVARYTADALESAVTGAADIAAATGTQLEDLVKAVEVHMLGGTDGVQAKRGQVGVRAAMPRMGARPGVAHLARSIELRRATRHEGIFGV
jgi:UDP-glucose 4-epimerase